MDRKKIIIVDDNKASLDICKMILKPYYAPLPVLSVARMFEILNKVTPDLIILDVEMPDINGFDALQQIKANTSLEGIPVAFLTSHIDYESEKRGRALGAVEYFRKPMYAQAFLRRVGAIFENAKEDTAGKMIDDLREIRNMLKYGGGVNGY
ncbi:MAG TPA: hypothetical protein DEB31_08275 [Clostridiales bacterium]|nr:hypothetical protein [Clostridiales bacterium]